MKNLFQMIVLVLLIVPGNNIFPEGKDDLYKPFAQVMPEPKDGLQILYSKIKYPPDAQKAGVEGKVYLLIYINEKGDVDDVKVLKGLGAGCDEAAVAAVKDTKFAPGKDNGAAIKVKLSLPITFKLTS
ncbi:MAG: energy transducer TonB [Ignavibacteriaceae bacterium]